MSVWRSVFAFFEIEGWIVVSCPLPVWWTQCPGFLKLLQVWVESLRVVVCYFGGQAFLISASLQFRVEFMSAALCSFGEQICWTPAAFVKLSLRVESL